jgi:hypothetical protein
MDLRKIIKICKAKQRYYVLSEGESQQWLGDDVAYYALSNHARLTPQYLTAEAGLSPNDAAVADFKSLKIPECIDISDNTYSDEAVMLSDIEIINTDGATYRPVFTGRGLRLINSKYLAPFKNDEITLFQRFTAEGGMYYVVSCGMFVTAVIIDQSKNITPELISNLKSLYQAANFAFEKLNNQTRQQKKTKEEQQADDTQN